ncbi:AEC family transporter [Cyclobacteriaceae bacterium]|nr:AEC family transporter [Cyclobacteriaceae bacterium]
MLSSFEAITPLFLLIVVGIVLIKTKIGNLNWSNTFNKYALNLGFPALIFHALASTRAPLGEYSTLIVVNSGYILLCFTVATLAFRKLENKSSFVIGIIFHNIAFLGIPIIDRLIGVEAKNEAIIIAATYLFWVFTLGIIFLEKENAKETSILALLKSLAKNPLLLAVLSGVIFNIFQIHLPTIIKAPISLIAQSVTPVILISIGIFFGSLSISKKDIYQPFLFTVITLIICPLGLFATSDFININMKSSIIEAAMPMALTPFTLAEAYPSLNKRFIATAILLSTALSYITIPLWKHLIYL